MAKFEREFQSDLIKEIRHRFPGSVVFKNDEQRMQGVPDLTILYENKWAALEVKKSGNAPHRPNQDYYVNKFNEMSFCRFVYPENKEAVLNDLEQTFKS